MEEFYNLKEQQVSPTLSNSSSLDEKEWIVLNELINSPFFTGSFNGRDELVKILPNDIILTTSPTFSSTTESNSSLLSSPTTLSSSCFEESFLPPIDDIEVVDNEDYLKHTSAQDYYSSSYKSIILTPEFLISLDVFSKNMNWISKEVALKCIQSSQITTNKIKSISQIIGNQCRVIASLTSLNSPSNCEVQF